VAAISGAVNKLMSAQATQDLPQRLDVTLRHLQSLAARFDAQGGPILNDVRGNLAEMNKALLAAQAALAKLDTAADRVAELAKPDSRLVAGMTQASDELAKAAAAVRSLSEQESPTTQNLNAALKEIARAADALRLLAETLEQQPDAIWRGKRRRQDPNRSHKGGDIMKLVRYGPSGQEKPGLIAADGTLRDLSSHVGDIGWAELSDAGQARLRALNVTTLPKVAASLASACPSPAYPRSSASDSTTVPTPSKRKCRSRPSLWCS
jgi:lambda repressor-like predicted transcriptional regulator